MAFLLKVYCDFKQIMMEINIWKAFAIIGFTYDIDEIPYRLPFDEENSDKILTSWSYGNAIYHWIVCRSDSKNQNWDRLTSRDKSIWSKYFTFLTIRNKDMWSIEKLKMWTFGRIRWMSNLHSMLFDIIIGIYIEPQLNIFSFVIQISNKTDNFGVSEIWATVVIEIEKFVQCPISRALLTLHRI
jgi:uncharacterized protein (UPF0248 family)